MPYMVEKENQKRKETRKYVESLHALVLMCMYIHICMYIHMDMAHVELYIRMYNSTRHRVCFLCRNYTLY